MVEEVVEVVEVVEVELVFSMMDAIAVRHLPTEGNGVAELPDLRRNRSKALSRNEKRRRGIREKIMYRSVVRYAFEQVCDPAQREILDLSPLTMHTHTAYLLQPSTKRTI